MIVKKSIFYGNEQFDFKEVIELNVVKYFFSC